MIAHIVTFVWKDGTDPEQVAGLGDRLRAMAASIPAVRYYRAGGNLHLRPNGGDFAVMAIVDDEAALTAYLDHPAHVEAVAQGITPHLGTRTAVQLDIGEFPV
jgi:hypothetical protein